MPLLYLVRHGRVADDSATPDDPELGEQGLEQARAVARELSARLPRPLPILTSPMRRCRETAAPLTQLWQTQPVVEPRVIEVPSPPGVARQAWLKLALTSSWTELEPQNPQLANWRMAVREAVLACRHDTVIFCHYVPINALVGLATQRDRVVCFKPDNASVTVIETEGEQLRLVELGREVTTRVV
jgi:broad specificity phosphatase PhoE